MARRAIEWPAVDARAEAHRLDVPASVLEEYAGRYAEYTFAVREERLLAANSARSEKTDALIPITPVGFKPDAESQVEFTRAASGRVSGLQLCWNDGWIDVLSRTD